MGGGDKTQRPRKQRAACRQGLKGLPWQGRLLGLSIELRDDVLPERGFFFFCLGSVAIFGSRSRARSMQFRLPEAPLTGAKLLNLVAKDLPGAGGVIKHLNKSRKGPSKKATTILRKISRLAVRPGGKNV